MSEGKASQPGKISFGFKKAVPGIGQAGNSAAASSSRLRLDDDDVDAKPAGGAKADARAGRSKGGQDNARSKVRASLFDDDDSAAQNNTKKADAVTAIPRKTAASPSTSNGVAGAAPISKAQRARLEAAVELDASVNDYDSVYDAMKAGERAAAERREEEKRTRDPKYMDGYLKMAEQRKLDRQRAEAKKIQRERDAEGDEFKDTESFVTDAYKQQMQEIREAESKEKERDETDRQKSKGVAGFYKNILEDQDRAHQAAVAAAAAAPEQKSRQVEHEADEQSSTRRRIQEAREKGLDVRLNDDNEVVNELSLLSAGLNYFGKRKSRGEERDDDRRDRRERRDRYDDDDRDYARHKRHERDGAAEARALRDERRARESRMIEEQLLALQREREEAEQLEQEQRKEALMGRAASSQSGPQPSDATASTSTSASGQSKADRIAEARRRALERQQKESKS